MIPYGRQEIDESDIAAVVKTLQSDYLTQGPAVPAFENAIKTYCGADYAVAVNSATSALHIACLALDVKTSDWVWTSPNSFVASANCALYCGAQIDFVDINVRTGNMCVVALATKLATARQQGKLPKVVIPVHFAGQPCDMAAIHQLSQLYGFRIIEDASHAIGASYLSAKVGNCQYSDVCIFSFHPVKIITSAEGGMALTNDPQVARKMQMLRSHGITSDLTEMTEATHGPWYYQQIMLGFNYRMTDLHAALGLSQFQRIDQFVARRHQLAARYQQLLQDLPVELLQQSPDQYSAYHLLVCLLPTADNEYHQQMVTQLRAKGIVGHVHYIPIHLQPYYQQLGFKAGDFPQAEHYYLRAVTLPLFTTLTDAEVEEIVAVFAELLSAQAQ